MSSNLAISIKACLVLVLCYIPVAGKAQEVNFKLVCPLNDAIIVPPSKNSIHFDSADLSLVLTSIPDSVVKACRNARITNTETDEDGKYGVVLFAKINKRDYYFWYTGLEMIHVKKYDYVKEGQPIGFIKPGKSIRLMMYDFETPVDPAQYMDCLNMQKENK